jgi:hypothetical protein
METNSNRCPICKTEYAAHNIEEAVKYVKEYNRTFAKLVEENINLKKDIEKRNHKIQELQEKLRSHENTEVPEAEYTNLANQLEIEELIDKLKHPLVIQAIQNIIHGYDYKLNDQVISEHQDDLILDDHDLEDNSQIHDCIESVIDLTLAEQELVNQYKDPNFDFRKFIIKVSEPEESQTSRWSGGKEGTIFKYNRQGNYWIVNMDDCLYIVPQRKFKINEYSQDTLISVFDCRNYHSGKSEDFVLIKPGKVTAINEDGWQIIEPGILEF